MTRRVLYICLSSTLLAVLCLTVAYHIPALQAYHSAGLALLGRGLAGDRLASTGQNDSGPDYSAQTKLCLVQAPKRGAPVKAPVGAPVEAPAERSRRRCSWDHYKKEGYLPAGGGHWEVRARGYKTDR